METHQSVFKRIFRRDSRIPKTWVRLHWLGLLFFFIAFLFLRLLLAVTATAATLWSRGMRELIAKSLRVAYRLRIIHDWLTIIE
jgi:hypothetical protein